MSELKRYHIAHDGTHVSCIYCSDACVFKHENGEWIKSEDAIAAIAERDKEIERLREIIDRLTGHVECNTTQSWCDRIERNKPGYKVYLED